MAYVVEQDMYRIQLPAFEGPFDLLLFFIERDELDVHDIPIAQITRDFLDYIHQMETLNMEIASEFILVAGTLMKIKSKMLLPRPNLDENGLEIDPRQELVSRLLEYKRFKAVQDSIRELESEAGEGTKRSFARKEEKLFLNSEFPEEELVGIDLYTIMRTFKRLWGRHQDRMDRPKHVVRRYAYTVDQCKDKLMAKLEEKEKFDFVSYILDEPNKMFCVFTFLSVLEMAQHQKLRIIIGEGYNNFWITRLNYKKSA